MVPKQEILRIWACGGANSETAKRGLRVFLAYAGAENLRTFPAAETPAPQRQCRRQLQLQGMLPDGIDSYKEILRTAET
jgi:hypothetical protein